jgi:hypothetical protein
MALRPVRLKLEAIDRITKPVQLATGQIRAMKAPIANLRRSFRDLGRESGVTRLGAQLGRLTRRVALLGAAGAGLAAAGFGKFIEHASELGDAATKLGVGVEALQELRFAAEQSGVSLGDLDTSLLQLQRRSAEVAAGKKGDATLAFRALGISVRDAAGKIRPAEDLLEAIEAKLEGIREPALRTRIAMALFGRSGASMLQLLSGGAGELGRLRQEARDLGITLDHETTFGAKEAGDQLAKLKNVARGVGFTIAGALLPDVLKVTRGAVAWAIANRELIRTRVLAFAKDLAATLRETVRVARDVVAVVRPIVETFGFWKTAAGALSVVIGGQLLAVVLNLAVAMKSLGLTSAVALLPFIKFIAIAAAIGAVVAGLVWIVKNRKKVVAFFAELLKAAGVFVDGIVARIGKAIAAVLEKVKAAMVQVQSLLPDFLKGGFPIGLPDFGNLAGAAAGGGQQRFGGEITVELAGPGAEGARVRRLQSSDDLDLAVRQGRSHMGGG